MRIAISGKSGCGNTTVSNMVSEALGFVMINFTFRSLAQEYGIEFWEFCKLAEQSDDYDLEVDRRQVEMALAVEDCVLGSRLAIWMLKEADLKIYLTATTEERARRVLKREGGTLAQRYEETTKRDKNDSARYERLYGINNSDTSIADMVIDTTSLQPGEVAAMIIAEAKKLQQKGNA